MMDGERFSCMRMLSIFLVIAALLRATEPPFVEGKLTGQLGNQMFVIAATFSLALDHDAIPLFPDLLLDKTNGIPFNFSKVFYHLNTEASRSRVRAEYREPFYHYSPIPYTDNMQIYGYFQSEKYFKNHKEEILKLFAPHPEIQEYLALKYKDLLAHPNTVSLHMRSYYDHDPEQKVFIQYGRSYFEKAMELFGEDALFVVFSNRMEECKKELAHSRRTIVFIEGEERHHDLYLMSLCKHNIICNSSFSWWAAYLNPSPQKIVIAPPKWYSPGSGLDDKDVVPQEWRRL